MPILKTARHEKFAQALAAGMTATEAYATAGYKGDRTAASRLSTNVNIEARVAELVNKGADKAEATVVRVLQELSRIGFSDIRQAFDEHGNLLLPDQWSDAFAASVASIEVVTKTIPGRADDECAKVEYVHKIKVWDKNSALEKIAKHLGMFVDRIEHSGPQGGPIQTESRTWRDVLRSEKS